MGKDEINTLIYIALINAWAICWCLAPVEKSTFAGTVALTYVGLYALRTVLEIVLVIRNT